MERRGGEGDHLYVDAKRAPLAGHLVGDGAGAQRILGQQFKRERLTVAAQQAITP